MAATALDLITDSFQKLGIYAPGDVISDADAQRALSVLNDMLDSWSNESLTCFEILEQSGTLQPGVAAYTVGSGGTFNVTRPLKLIDGPGSAYVQDNNANNYPIEVVPRSKWNMIGSRAVTSNIPSMLFYDPQFPLGIINIFPVPTQPWTLFWDSYQQLGSFTNLTTVISLPPGYKKAIQDTLAVELHPYFLTTQINPIILEAASKSKGNIKRTNMRPIVAIYDPEIVSRSSGSYNIYRDSK